jgi:hypothetical protein
LSTFSELQDYRIRFHLIDIHRGIIIENGPATAIFLATMPAMAAGFVEGEVNTGHFGTVAIGGYDPVAYFTMKKAVEGNPEFSY